VASLATMFVGTVLWQHHAGHIPGSTAVRVGLLGAVSVQVVAALDLAGRGIDRSTVDAAHWPAFAVAWALAYAIVAAAYLSRERPWPRALLWLGTVSYSLYLFHPVVINALQRVDPGAPLTFVLWLAGSIAAAAAVHRVIEVPAIAMGRRARTRPS
jgi:peptidoglycan/LPS O-acetylase OafA/YrhL